MTANVKIDVFFHGIKQLQQEKTGLEQKLRDLRTKRGELESTLERLAVRQGQVERGHGKMNETLKVAQIKVSQTQKQCEEAEVQIQSIRQRLQEQTDNIEKCKNLKQEEIEAFERGLAGLTATFKDARKYYTKENLQGEIIATEKKAEELGEEVGISAEEEERLIRLLASLQLKKEKAKKKPPLPVPARTQEVVTSLVDEDLKEALKVREDLIEQRNAMEKCLDKVKREASGMRMRVRIPKGELKKRF